MIVHLVLFLKINFLSPNCHEIEMVRNVDGHGSSAVGLWIRHVSCY